MASNAFHELFTAQSIIDNVAVNSSPKNLDLNSCELLLYAKANTIDGNQVAVKLQHAPDKDDANSWTDLISISNLSSVNLSRVGSLASTTPFFPWVRAVLTGNAASMAATVTVQLYFSRR